MSGYLLLLFVLKYAWSIDVDRVVVYTNKGPIVGNKDDGEFMTFFGVPYAKVNEDNPFGVSEFHIKLTKVVQIAFGN